MIKVQEYVNAKDYSTLKVGGQFRYFIEIESKEDLNGLHDLVRDLSAKEGKDIPILVLGGGSNILFKDGVISVLALKIRIKGFEMIKEEDSYVYIKAGSGEIWDKFVERTVDLNLSGVEALSLIPGTVGATPVQNVGAYGAEVKDTILEVEVFDIEKGSIHMISNKDCKFGYRDSIFKNEAKGKYIITAVTYKLNKIALSQKTPQTRASLALTYPGVIKYFEERKINNPTLAEIRSAIIFIRNEKLPNPKEIPNVGSFFKNPIVENEVAEKILKDFPDATFYQVDLDFTKIPAGWLIEKAGLKGKSFGKVSVYSKNALVLVNTDDATSSDISSAKNKIIEIVKDKFGIVLEQEPEIV